MKLSLINAKVKFNNNQIFSISSSEIEFLSKAGLIRKKHKKYLIYINYHDYHIFCPIVKDEKGKFTVIIPAFKIPNSNIPIFVHLYAVGLYLSLGESMRKVADKVKKLFGLTTFSHTTISRTLKKMICKLEENPEYYSNENPQITSQINLMDKKAINESCDNPKIIVRRNWNFDYIKKAKILLTFLLPVVAKSREDIISNGTRISYDFYNKNNKYCA